MNAISRHLYLNGEGYCVADPMLLNRIGLLDGPQYSVSWAYRTRFCLRYLKTADRLSCHLSGIFLLN